LLLAGCGSKLGSENSTATEICDDGIDNDLDGSSGTCRPTGTLLVSSSEFTISENRDHTTVYAFAGDVDGNGTGDVLLGAPNSSANGKSQGGVYLFLAPPSGPVSMTTADLALYGDGAGAFIAVAGDVSGQGGVDLLVGSTAEAWLVPDVGTLFGTASLTDTATSLDFGDGVHHDLAAPGDVTGDGIADLLLAGAFLGAVAVLPGPIDGPRTASTDGILLTQDLSSPALAATHDVDGDGINDFVVGDLGYSEIADQAGIASIVLGPVDADAVLADVSIAWLGTGQGDLAGAVVRGAGDVDGDGRFDILVGAPADGKTKSADPARIYLVNGAGAGGLLSDAMAVLSSGTPGSALGRAISGADVDRDGYSDLFAGDSEAGEDQQGTALLFYGPLQGTFADSDADLQIPGEVNGGALGHSVALAAGLGGPQTGLLVTGTNTPTYGFLVSGI